MSEWDQRILCPDGSCVGVIGDDGLWKVCGRAAPNWGDERKRGLEADAIADEEDDGEYEDDEVDEGEAAALEPESPAQIGDWKERKLCPDGACVGVIGDDNKCRTCGRAGE
jgi:hypothetical protein